MQILTDYTKNVVKYDLINKFNYKVPNQLPKLKSIVLTFKVNKYDVKTLSCCLAAAELISDQKPKLTQSKVSNISLKIRKGMPVGCKITLRKKKLKHFLFKLMNKFQLTELKIASKNKLFYSCRISNMFIFNVLEKNYQFFKNLSDLNINISTTTCKNEELLFLLKSYKLVKKQM